MTREVQAAIERLESAEKALAKVAFATIDPIASNNIREIVERDLKRARGSLEYVRDAHSGNNA